MQVVPYLVFDGQCAEAVAYYAEVLGGAVEVLMTHGESAIADQVPPDWHDRVLHARLAMRGQILMASDSPPGQYQQPQGFAVSLQVEQPAEAARIFQALAEGGTVTMPFEKTFWAAGGFGMLVDRFGIPWMVNCERAA